MFLEVIVRKIKKKKFYDYQKIYIFSNDEREETLHILKLWLDFLLVIHDTT